MRKKVLIVDDHQIVIDGLRSLLQGEDGFEVTGECANPLVVMDMLAATQVDILLTDIHMNGLSGVELTRQVKKEYPNIRILALSMFGDSGVIRQMIDAGVDGYVLKNTGKHELIDALDKIASGNGYFSPAITQELTKALANNNNDGTHLTNREIEIIRLIEKEYSNKQIADELCISERTVETHRKNIFRKTNTQNVVGLLKYAYENKIV